MSKDIELCITVERNGVSIERYISSAAELKIGDNSMRLDDEALHNLQQVVNAFVAATRSDTPPNKNGE